MKLVPGLEGLLDVVAEHGRQQIVVVVPLMQVLLVGEEAPKDVVNWGVQRGTPGPFLVHAQRIQTDTSRGHAQSQPI